MAAAIQELTAAFSYFSFAMSIKSVKLCASVSFKRSSAKANDLIFNSPPIIVNIIIPQTDSSEQHIDSFGPQTGQMAIEWDFGSLRMTINFKDIQWFVLNRGLNVVFVDSHSKQTDNHFIIIVFNFQYNLVLIFVQSFQLYFN